MSGRSKTTAKALAAARRQEKKTGPLEWSLLFGTGHVVDRSPFGGVYLSSGHGDAVWLPDSFRFGA